MQKQPKITNVVKMRKHKETVS